MYIYPDNLKAKATMWLWSLKDLAIVGIIILFSVFAFAYAGVWFPLVIAGAYAFLTIQVEDTTIMDFIRYACAYCFMEQQQYECRYTKDKKKEHGIHQRIDGYQRSDGLQYPNIQE